jgi:hypothetical protein
MTPSMQLLLDTQHGIYYVIDLQNIRNCFADRADIVVIHRR